MYLTELERIASVASRKLKMRYVDLTWGPTLQKIVKYTYDPYIRFHTTLRQVKHNGKEGLKLSVLDNLKGRQLEAYAATLKARDQEVLRRIVCKDLRVGLGAKSFLQIWPGLFELHGVMLAHELDWNRVKYPCWATAKLDGLRAIWHRGEFYTRNGHLLKGLSHLKEVLPKDVKLDGELIVPKESFYSASGLIRNYKEVPEIEFHIIDVPNYDERDFKQRILAIKHLASRPKVDITAGFKCRSKNQVLKAYKYFLSRGYEGIVVKPLEYKYVLSRSYSWMKLKPILTFDAKVVDFFEGTGRNSGRLGGLVVKYNNELTKVGTGFSDAQREEFWDNPPIGRIAEVKCQELTPSGAMRHPRFVQLREDKD